MIEKVCHERGQKTKSCFFAAAALTLLLMEDVFYKWLIESILGMILIGFGLSLFGQAVIYTSSGEPLRKWFLWGTISLIVVNAGICVFGDAVKQRIIYETAQPNFKKVNP